MRIDLLFPAFPPRLDGIGDYTALLSQTLSEKGESVRVWTAQPDPTPVPGVSVRSVFDPDHLRESKRFLSAIASDSPQWLVVQYNPFSYGRYGWAWHLIRTLRAVRRRCPSTRIALMAHESFVDTSDFRQNSAFILMTLWQRAQFFQLGRLADLVLLSTEPRTTRFASSFSDTPVHHLPVASNIPRVATNRQRVRSELGIASSTFVAGLFGTAHVTRLLGMARTAVQALHDQDQDMVLLYVGPDGPHIQATFDGLPVHDVGALPPHDVSEHIQAMDVFLTPFQGGVSTRRGTFMAGLQHAVPTLSTYGPDTDEILRSHDRRAFILTADDDERAFAEHALALRTDERRRAALGATGRALYEASFDWPRLSEHLLSYLTPTNRARETQAQSSLHSA